jgi:AhpC/TSA antioxidant enzyme
VWSQRHTLERSGARLVFIGNGQPNWIDGFRRDLGIDQGVVLTDPSLSSFKAAGMKHGFFQLMRPQSAINIRKLSKEGYSQGSLSADSGSHFQMGGVLAVSRFGKVMYHFASTSVGDFPQEPYMDVIAWDESVA